MSAVALAELLGHPWAATALTAALSAVLATLLTYLFAQRTVATLRAENARLGALLESERQAHEDKLDAYDEARDQLHHSFLGLSRQALADNNEAFLRLAHEHLGQLQLRAQHELQTREQAIEALVSPLRDTLERTRQELRAVEQDRHTAQGALTQQLKEMAQAERELQAETRNLSQALRRPEVRGRWGELSLRRLVELAGMSPHCDFDEQVTVSGTAGALRPDLIIHLPDEREVVVDVKTPLDAYLEAVEASDDGGQRAALERHARNVRARVRELSTKAYWAQFPRSPDFVVLFIPGEAFLSAALEHDPVLLEDALKAKVIVATPTSLIAILRAVAFGWRQLAIVRNADRIRAIGEDFYQRLGAFTGHLADLGKGLTRSVEHFNRSVGALEQELLPGARKFAEMGIQTPAGPVPLTPVERRVRAPAAAPPSPALEPTTEAAPEANPNRSEPP